MTAINAICLKKEALIATDSLLYTYAGQPVGLAPKVWSLPHLGSAIAFRGNHALSVRLYVAITQRLALIGGFDELADEMPEIVEGVIAEAEAELAANGLEDKAAAFLAYDLFVTGWSAAAGRMLLKCGVRRNGQGGQLQRFDFLAAPGIPGTDHEDAWGRDSDVKPVDLRQIARYMERQRQYAARTLTASQAGMISGEVILVHVTKDAIQTGRIARFADFDLRLNQIRKIAATGAVPTARGLTNDNMKIPVRQPAKLPGVAAGGRSGAA